MRTAAGFAMTVAMTIHTPLLLRVERATPSRRQLYGWQRMEYESVVAVRRCKREFFECLLFAEQIL